MDVALLVIVVAIVVAAYLSFSAGRLDRLHVRVEAARAALDAQLVRRAVASERFAERASAAGWLPPAEAAGVAKAAATARDERHSDDREIVENDLSRALRSAFASLTATPTDLARTDDTAAALLAELETATTRVALARNFYNGAVADTLALRRGRLVRLLRLAGHAALPPYFEIDDTPLPLEAARATLRAR